MIKRLLLALMFFPLTAFASITISLTTTVAATCVAPCTVFFDASATTSTATTKPFHDIEYRWNFGDAQAKATWSYGAQSGLSKNEARGAVAGHVYETAGSYTARLLAWDGASSATTTQAITVVSADAYSGFLTTKTVCVNNVGDSDFTGCPSGATQNNTNSWNTAVAYITGSVRRLLFKRAGTWTSGAAPTISVTGPGLVGAYGSGVKPIITKTNNSEFLVLSSNDTPTMTDWRVMDLEFNGASQGTTVEGVISQGGVSKVLLLRLYMHDLFEGVNFGVSILDFWNANGHPGHSIYDLIAVVDSDVRRTSGNGGSGAFIATGKLLYLGNNVDDTSDSTGSHNIRVPYALKGVISNNTLNKPGASKHVIKLHAPDGTSALLSTNPTQYVVVSDNLLIGATGVDNIVSLGPQSDGVDERVIDVVLERNWIKTTGGGQNFVMVQAYSDISVRANVIDTTNGLAHNAISVARRGVGAPSPNRIWIYNNTAYNADASASFVGVTLDVNTSNAVMKNNLTYSPNVPSAVFLSDAGSTTPTSATNSTNAQTISVTTPFVAAVPATPALTDFQLSAGSIGKNAGSTVPLYAGMGRRIWPTATSAWDIGAWSSNVKTRGAACSTAGC